MLSRSAKCPCCGQDVPATDDMYLDASTRGVYRGARWVYLTPRQFDIFVALRGKSLSCEQLIHAVYGHDPDGGPDDPRTIIHVMVNQANKRLEMVGLAIRRDRKFSWFSHYRIHAL